MPVAPRPSNKAKQIAYNILGKPANLKKEKKTRVKRRLEYDTTRLSR